MVMEVTNRGDVPVTDVRMVCNMPILVLGQPQVRCAARLHAADIGVSITDLPASPRCCTCSP